jgi:hypothetical protein
MSATRLLLLASLLPISCAPKDGPKVVVGPPADPTFKEIADHLRGNGLPVTMFPHGKSGVFFVLTDDADEARSAFDHFDGALKLASTFAPGAKGVLVVQHASENEARQAAGRHDSGTWHWGKFFFRSGDQKNLDAIKKALG